MFEVVFLGYVVISCRKFLEFGFKMLFNLELYSLMELLWWKDV